MKQAASLALLLLGACVTPSVSGLMPISPPPDNGRTDSVQPTLRWEPLPGGDDPRITDLVYDVRVFEGRSGLLMDIQGLTACEYPFERPLQADREYRWTVRARFRWEGRRRQTDWSRLSDPTERSAMLAGPPPKYLPFRTPEKQ